MSAKAKDGIFVGGWVPDKLNMRRPAACESCGGTGVLFQLDAQVDFFMIIDRYVCPGCRGACCKEKLDRDFTDVDLQCAPEATEKRGRVGDEVGNGFSGYIIQRHGKVVRFQRALEVGRILL